MEELLPSKKRSFEQLDVDEDPITGHRTVHFPARDVNPHLVCRICAGYFRDASTIVECLHTFCKSCLLKEFRKGLGVCPHCNVYLGPNPTNVIMFDRTLQEIVDKIFPELEEKDKKEEEEFYKDRGISLKPEFAAVARELHNSEPRKRLKRATAGEKEEFVRFKITPERESDIAAGESKSDVGAGAGAAKSDRLPSLQKPYLRTQGKLKMAHLKKYLCRKLGISNTDEIEILCNGEVLGQELSLNFISRTRWCNSSADLTLHYRRRKRMW